MKKRATILILILVISILLPSCNGDTGNILHLDGFKITLWEPRVEFPDSIKFEIEAEANNDISKIALHYQIDKLSSVPITSIVFLNFDTTEKVKTDWQWEMRKTGGLPPGTELRYWWSIEDVAGNSVNTITAVLSFDDQRHPWKSLTNNNIRLFWYEGSDAFAQDLLTAGNDALQRLAKDIGAQPEMHTRIYVYASSEDLRAAMIFPQEWTGGVAFTEYGTTAIGIPTDSLHWGKRALAHELAHLVIHQFIFSGYGMQLPAWLDEGLAMYAEGDLTGQMRELLQDAVEKDQLISVRSLCSSFPAQPEAAYLAYAESYSLVEFLLQESNGGQARMLELLRAFKNGSSYTEALDHVYDLTMDELDRLWRDYLGSSFAFVELDLVGGTTIVCAG